MPESPRPHNIEAEQTFLGAVLVNNDALRKATGIEAEHFFDPVHQRIFAICKSRIDAGQLASPITIKHVMADDDGLEQLGGPQYLVRLAGAATSTGSINDFAVIITDLWARRCVIDAAEEAIERTATDEPVLEITAELETRIFEAREKSGAEPVSTPFTGSILSAVQLVSDAYMRGDPPGVKTGLTDLDKLIGCFRDGHLIVIGGRPSMGKTSLAMNLAQKAASEKKVILASLEMSDEEIAVRGISQDLREAGHHIPYTKIGNGWLSENEMRLFIEQSQRTADTTKNLRTISKKASRRDKLISAIRGTAKGMGGCDMVVVDYLQRIGGLHRESEFDSLSNASTAMKTLAQELQCPVVLLSQLNRGVEARDDKRPRMSDFRGTGRLEEDLDVAIMVYREEYYLEREKPTASEDIAAWGSMIDQCKDRMELLIQKNRGGRIGDVMVHCELPYNFIADLPSRGFDF